MHTLQNDYRSKSQLLHSELIKTRRNRDILASAPKPHSLGRRDAIRFYDEKVRRLELQLEAANS